MWAGVEAAEAVLFLLDFLKKCMAMDICVCVCLSVLEGCFWVKVKVKLEGVGPVRYL